MADELLRPAEVCRRLEMAPSTLRIYSAKFRELLSGTASEAGGEGRPGHRLYSSRDVLLLSRAKELLAQGLTYEQALAELRLAVPGRGRGRAGIRGEVAQGEVPAATPAVGEMAAIGTAGLVESLKGAVASAEKASEACRVLAETQGREIANLRARVEALERVGMVTKGRSGRGERETMSREVEKSWWRRFFGG